MMNSKLQTSVDTRFAYLNNLVDMVLAGSRSLIICGDGGLGKTYAVTERLKFAGLRSRTDFVPVFAPVRTQYIRTRNFRGGSTYVYETESAGNGQQTPRRGIVGTPEYDYEIVKGYSTPKALYRSLFENRERITIFDDCDSIWRNQIAVSILKSALDSYSERWVSWHSELRGSDALPQQFLFNGRIIFISNLPLVKLDKPVLSRCLCVDASMTTREKLERIASKAPSMRPDVPRGIKQEVFNLLVELAEQAGDLNFRTFLKVLEIRLTGNPAWRDLARYVVTAI